MNILIIHQNFPGQFKHIALDLLREGKHSVVAVCEQSAPGLGGVPTLRYKIDRANTKGLHRYLVTLESCTVRGQAVARVLVDAKQNGYRPDVVLAHPGWGEALFVSDIFPNVRLVSFFEFFYRSTGADTGFDPAYPVTLDDRARLRIKNAVHLLNLDACDAGVSPTQWQKSVHPPTYHPKIEVLHEGIDVEKLGPDSRAEFVLPNGKKLAVGDAVLTYVARNLEPYRGFVPFMHALPGILEKHPRVEVVIVGGDGVSYGTPPKDAVNWRAKLTKEVGLEGHPNVHFLGRIPYDRYACLLRVSKAHIYLTYPFVLSWSMLEAMSSGALVIASSTAPVVEVVEHGRNGLLVDFFDTKAIGNAAVAALKDEIAGVDGIRQTARRTVVERFNFSRGIAGYRRLLGV